MSGSGLTDAEIQIIIRQLFEEDLPPKEEERLLTQLERAEDDVLPVLQIMLRSTDHRTLETAAAVLAGWTADERTIENEIVKPLRRLLQDPSLPDRNKVAIASILAEQGAPVDPEAFRDQLQDPHEMIRATLRAALHQADSDMARAAFLESLQDEPLDVQAGLVHDLSTLDDPRAPRFLAPLLYSSEEAIVEAVLDVVDGMLEAPAELHTALENLTTESPNADIRERASRLLARLTSAPRLVPVTPLHGAWITSVDGDGGQMIVAARRLAPDNLTMLNVYFNDVEGIQDYTVVEGVSPGELDGLLADLQAEGVLVVEADLETCRGLLAGARAASLAAGSALPLSFGVWRDFLAGDDPRDLPALPLAPTDVAAHPEWLSEADQLLEHPAFVYWFFDPDELPGHLIEAYRQAGSEQARQSVIEDALEAYADAELQSLLHARLWRQAGVLARLGDDEAVNHTLAAAGALAVDSDVAATQHPLLRAMMRRTLEGKFEAS